MTMGTGDRFFQETKRRRDDASSRTFGTTGRPEQYKRYPDAPVVELPPPSTQDGPGLWEVLARRSSERSYLPQPVTLAQLSQMLWASQGITHRRSARELRASPSAGACYPVETYLVVNACQGVPTGIHHYDVQHHRLELVRPGDFREATAAAAFDQQMLAYAPLVFVWTAIFQRTRFRYSQQAYRYIHLDAGHIAAHLSLAAVALGLGSCQVAAFFDDEVNQLLGLDGLTESVIYMTSVGHTA